MENNWFTETLKSRMRMRKNNLILATGEASSGKSYAMLRLCEVLDKTFNVDRVIFDPKEFFQKVLSLKENQWILIDEPAQALSHREWYKDVNKIITWTIESFRFRLIHVCLTAINPNLIDKVCRDYLIHWLIHMQDRGYGKVYRYESSVFENKVRTPFCGEVYFKLPSEELCKEYEEKRAKVQLTRYKDYFEGILQRESQSMRFAEIVREVSARKDEFVDKEGRINPAKIMLEFQCGRNRAYEIKRLLDNE